MKKHYLFLFIIFLFIACPYPNDPLNPFRNVIPDNTIRRPFLAVVNGISENLSFINRRGDELFTSDKLTGQFPNHMIKYGNDIFIVNSGSNSILVLDYKYFEYKLEFSVGTGKSPQKAAVVNNDLYITANYTHELLKYSSSGSNKATISLDSDGSYDPFPSGIAKWNDYVFVACTYSEDDWYINLRNTGKVAVYNTTNESLSYMEAGAKNTNNVYINDNILYIISSGSYGDSNGMIQKLDLNDVSDDLDDVSTVDPAKILTVATGNSFGPLCINNNKAWTGNLSDGTLTRHDITTTPWTVFKTKTFPGNGTFAYIPDIKYDPTENRIYVTEFNGNYLYILDPDTLSAHRSYESSTNSGGDAQFILMMN